MNRTFTIYFTSDIHGFFAPVDYATGKRAATGLACCASQYDHDGNSLVIDGGDTLQGSPLTYYLYHGHHQGACVPAQVMNLAGYDFITLGNHDFNFGKEETARYLRESKARCLCANVEGLAETEKWTVVTLENGLRIGLTGVVTHFVNLWEKPEHIEGLTISDAFTAAKDTLAELKKQNVDLTVCIYHGGFETDISTGEHLAKTDENQGWRICHELDFDVLLCSHQHQAHSNLVIGGTNVCMNQNNARHFTKMEVRVEEAGNVTATSRQVNAGTNVLPVLDDYLTPLDAQIQKWLDIPVGHLDVPLLPGDHMDMAANGSLIANFFNQVQLEASGADISCSCLANVVKGFNQDVTIRDIVSTYVFANTLKTIGVTRSVLKTALERCAEYFAFDENGQLTYGDSFVRPMIQHYNFDHFSGIQVTMDLRREIGDRVVSIQFRGQELAEDRQLKLALNSYRASGAGGYEVYADCPLLRDQPTEIVEMIMEYVDTHKNITVDKSHWLKLIY